MFHAPRVSQNAAGCCRLEEIFYGTAGVAEARWSNGMAPYIKVLHNVQ